MIKTQRARMTRGAGGLKKGRWKVAESCLEVKRTTEAHRGREKLRESQSRSQRARARAKELELEPKQEPEREPKARARVRARARELTSDF